MLERLVRLRQDVGGMMKGDHEPQIGKTMGQVKVKGGKVR